MAGKGGAEVSPKIAAIVIVILVVVVGYFLWSKTGKKTAVVSNEAEFKAAYQNANANRPGAAAGRPEASQMQEAINRARMQGHQPTGGGTQ